MLTFAIKQAIMDIDYIINHLGEERENYYGAVVPPVIQTSNFCFASVEEMRKNINHEFDVPFYTRGNNPTVAILRKKIAALEHTEDALITSSGCAAITAVLMANLRSGDHAICVTDCYSWTNTLFTTILNHFGIYCTMIDGCDNNDFEKAIRPETKLIYLESPTSFSFKLQDIVFVTSLAKSRNILTVIDNSYSTPINQNPAEMGIDLIVHSASKYINGHSDVVAGVICGSSAMIKKIFATEYMAFGGIPSPETAWLILRGLRTLPMRMERAAANAEVVVSFLENHPFIEKVIHPFSTSHPQYALAVKQMKRCSSLFSFIIKTEDTAVVDYFCNSLNRFLLACSWGGHESLVFPASVLCSSSNNNKEGLSNNLVRMYVGMEEPELLIEDINQALNKSFQR